MTAAQGAAVYFAENPTIDSVLATSDGNVWPVAKVNLATHHAVEAGLEPPEELERGDLTAEIAVTELAIQAREAVNDTSRGVTLVALNTAPEAPPTYAEERAALATALGIAALTNLEEDYEADGVTLVTIDAVIATWYRSGLSVAAWAAQNQATREAAVAAEFSDFIALE